MKEWKVETPNDARALKQTLDKLTQDRWTIEFMTSTPGFQIGVLKPRFTVVASREAA
jgi:hypothetical protein